MPKKPAYTVYLGIGSNLNQPIWQIARCLSHLNRVTGIRVKDMAKLYQSKAWGVEEQPDFINTVLKIETELTPLAILKVAKTIEYRLMQRRVNQRWHSRVIDIDILLYNGMQINSTNLVVPHPWISQRCFVIQPLLDLSPKLPCQLNQQIHKHRNQCNCLNALTPLKTPDFIKNRLKLL